MARLVLVKDLANVSQGITNVIISSIIGDIDIKKHNPETTYNSGDMAYQIIGGKIVVKVCNQDNTIGEDFETNWDVTDSIISGLGSQNKNSFQSISAFEKKLTDDITALTNVVGSMADLSAEGLNNSFMFPLFTEDEVFIDGGIYEFGRVII